MVHSDLTRKAADIAFTVHKDQYDKAGMPYIYHIFHVADSMMTEETTCAALLHDVLEDTAISTDQLKSKGFPDSIIHAIQLLTHIQYVPYLEYIENLKTNDIARIVKIADLKHNMDLSRLPEITEKDQKRLKKYQKALSILQDYETNLHYSNLPEKYQKAFQVLQSKIVGD